jgi:hypothetical protein
MGVERTIPIQLPEGFVMHDVVESGAHWTVVVRAQSVEDFGAAKAAEHPRQRIFEFNANSGSLVREFVFQKPEVQDVTCAANLKMTAIFLDAIPDASAVGVDVKEAAKQRVVATVAR